MKHEQATSFFIVTSIGNLDNLVDLSDDVQETFATVKDAIKDGKGSTKKISTLKEFVEYRKGDVSLIVPKHNRAPKKDKK